MLIHSVTNQLETFSIQTKVWWLINTKKNIIKYLGQTIFPNAVSFPKNLTYPESMTEKCFRQKNVERWRELRERVGNLARHRSRWMSLTSVRCGCQAWFKYLRITLPHELWKCVNTEGKHGSDSTDVHTRSLNDLFTARSTLIAERGW